MNVLLNVASPTMPKARLEAVSLSGGRAGRLVFAGVDLVLEPGSTTLLRGANGAGKSTLLRVLAGLAPPLAGEVLLTADTADEAVPENLVCLVAHENGAKPALTLRENLAFWAALYGTGPERIDAALAALDLAALADRRASALSAGQRRRLGLARAAVSGRPIWLLDEPTAAMDAAAAARASRLVTEHCAAGGAALVATHEPFDAPGAETVRLEAAA